MNIGILGCGAIGSRIAEAIQSGTVASALLVGIYDHHAERASDVARHLGRPELVHRTIDTLIKASDLVVEAVNDPRVADVIETIIAARRSVLVMSVGQLLAHRHLLDAARAAGVGLLIPSGAIAGIDGLRAAAAVGFSSITLTTRKPVSGFDGNEYVRRSGLDLGGVTGETLIFEGPVAEAVRAFPQNINVAATLALATRAEDKIKVRILTSPSFVQNSHEIEAIGPFGRIVTRTENAVCPDNLKTSYLAVLSAIETLRGFCSDVTVGT